jgi:aminoglycoside phosphotransferase (APT) family kinase protein
MHADEVDTDESLVHRLLAAQFPDWVNLPIERVPSAGTVNAIYRLGSDLVVRLPLRLSDTDGVDREQRWLPKLAPHLPLAIPVPVARGSPTVEYPSHWSVLRWLEGERWSNDRVDDLRQAAADLADFVAALRRIDTTGGPAPDPTERGTPLADRDSNVREAISDLGDRVNTGAVTAAWETSLEAPVWNDPPVWFHGDLLPGNLLVAGGRLCGVIDFGGVAVGDPSCDLMPAWMLFSGESRSDFRTALAAEVGSWLRGRGWALSVALIALPYYWDTNPSFVELARHTIDEVLAEHRRDG